MLVTNLQHTNAMPLLLALTKMEEAQFSEAVASIERFVFRYKIVANAHIGPATSLYQQQAAAIRKNPSTYKLSTLRTAMTTLLDKYVPDDVFDGHLRALKYLKGSAGNKHLRYLLNTLEDYFSWFKNGANGQPKPKDKSVMLEFSQLTVEHVYPQNAEAKDKNTPLESIKHYLGNLTVFSPADQKFAANKLFAAKKSAFQKSKLFLNREIGENAIWDASIVKKRTDALIKMATKVFVP